MGELTGVELQNFVYFSLGLVSLILSICLVRREEGQVSDLIFACVMCMPLLIFHKLPYFLILVANSAVLQAYVGDIHYGIHRSAIFVSIMWMTAQASTFFSLFSCSPNSLSQNLLLVVSDSAQGAMSLASACILHLEMHLLVSE